MLSDDDMSLYSCWEDGLLIFPEGMLNRYEWPAERYAAGNDRERIYEPAEHIFRWNIAESGDGHTMDLHSGEFIPLEPWVYDGEMHNLVSVEIRNTNICNHNCPWCYAGHDRGKEKLPPEIMYSIVESMIHEKVRVARFLGGGECLIDPLIPEYIKILQQNGIAVSLVTNGGYLDRFWSEYPDVLLNLKYLRISLDAGTPLTHSLQHGCGSGEFEYILSVIENISDKNRKSGSGLFIGCTYLINQYSGSEIITAAELFRNKGINVALFRAENMSLSWEKNDEKLINVLKQLSCLKNFKSDRFVATPVEFFLKIKDKVIPQKWSECYATLNKTTVMPNGDVKLCPCRDVSLGNLYNETLSSIWHGEKRRRIIGSLPHNRCINGCLETRFNKGCDFFKKNNNSVKKNIEYL